MMDAHTKTLIRKYGGAVPRYTSYPTALHFHDRFTAADTAPHLRGLHKDTPVSLYIHIPFCHSLCHYCGCHTKIVNRTAPITAYIETLCREIELTAALTPPGLKIFRIHFGGGSPNYAPLSDIAKIRDTINTAFPAASQIGPPQIDMECDPRLLTPEKIAALAALGVTRVSLGIQDFDPRVQRAVNRIQPQAHIETLMAAFHAHNLTAINFDLITGLPEQTRQSVQATAAATIAMRPQRIAVFSYAHVPWMKKHQKLLEKYRFPTPEDRFHMQRDIHHTLRAAGYDAIGMDHYALPHTPLATAQATGTMRRNFQGYTDDPATTILGFGLSAISQYESAYAQNTLDVTAYRHAIENGRLPTAKGYALTPADHTARAAIMQLMCNFHLDLRTHPAINYNQAFLSQLEQDGLIEQDGPLITATETGKAFIRVIASAFDPHLSKQDPAKEDRHAKAI